MRRRREPWTDEIQSGCGGVWGKSKPGRGPAKAPCIEGAGLEAVRDECGDVAGLHAQAQGWKQRAVLTSDLPAQGKRRAVGGCRG